MCSSCSTAGSTSIAALNVQHLDSLNDLVGRVTGVVVRETVPDSFLKRADQVGQPGPSGRRPAGTSAHRKIYAADKVPWALEHFFTEENLTHLRELALREVAESVERSSFARTPLAQPRERAAATNSRVMACMSSNPPRAAMLLRGLRGWPGVTTPTGSWCSWKPPTILPSASMRRSSGTCWPTSRRRANWARRWCGCAAEDPVDGSSTSRAHTASGTSSWGDRMWRGEADAGTIGALRLVKEGAGFDIHIVSLAEDEEQRPLTFKAKLILAQVPLAIALALVGGISATVTPAGRGNGQNLRGQLPQRACGGKDERVARANRQFPPFRAGGARSQVRGWHLPTPQRFRE